jgi:hypothetical protein
MSNLLFSKNFTKEPEHKSFLNKIDQLIVSANFSKYINVKDYKELIESFLVDQGAAKRIKVDIESQMYITAVYKKLGICVQFGNVSRFYADFIKLQHLYNIGIINEGLIITLSKEVHEHFKLSNCTNYERVSKEMHIFKTFINAPIIVMGVKK